MHLNNKPMNNLNARRKALGYTQQQLADMMCVSARTIQIWENGGNVPMFKRQFLTERAKNGSPLGLGFSYPSVGLPSYSSSFIAPRVSRNCAKALPRLLRSSMRMI